MRDRLAHWIDHIEERSGRYALALIGLTMLVGIVYSLLLGDHLRYFDEEAYFSLARTLVEEGRFSRDGIYLSSHRPPGYSAILAAGYALGMRVVGLRILNFLALAATMGLGYWMLRRFSRFGAVLVCVLPFLYPVLFYSAGTLYPQTFTAFFLTCVCYLLLMGGEMTLPKALGIGGLFGVLLLTVPAMIFPMGCVLVWLLYRYKSQAYRYCAAVILVTSVFLVPWMLRNYAIYDEFVFVSTNGGQNLLIGNSKFTNPSGVDVDISEYEPSGDLNAAQRDKHFKQEAVRYILDHPETSLHNYLLKVWNYFDLWTPVATKGEITVFRQILLSVSYSFLLLLLGARLLKRDVLPLQSYERFILLLYFGNAFFMAIFFTRTRFRLPFDMLLILLLARYTAFQLKAWTVSASTRLTVKPQAD